MSVRDELREQLLDEFEDAEFPVNSPMDLVPALSAGPSTKFKAGDFSMTAMELNTRLPSDYADFPYDTVEALVDDTLDGLEEIGAFDADD